MPATMSAQQFEEWRKKRRRWTLFLDTSEALVLLVTLGWGVEILYTTLARISDPISQSLQQTWPKIPLPFHGIGLVGVALIHLLGMAIDSTGVRRRMIMAEMVFYLYVEFSWYLARITAPGAFICPFYLIACILNYFSLLRPASTERAQCKPDN